MDTKAEQGAPSAQPAPVNPEAARILTALGACEAKIEKYANMPGSLQALWATAEEWEKIDTVGLLFDEREHAALCPVCGGTLPTWEQVRDRLIKRGLLPADYIVFAPIHSRSGSSNG